VGHPDQLDLQVQLVSLGQLDHQVILDLLDLLDRGATQESLAPRVLMGLLDLGEKQDLRDPRANKV